MSARTARTALTALAAVFLIAAEAPETRTEQYFRLRGEAGKAVQAGDLATAEARLEAALALYPSIPGSLIRLARVEVAAGKPQEAVEHLAAYAALGLTLDPARDPALKTLIDHADFAPVAARLVENRKPIGSVEVVATLNNPRFIGEGVAVTSNDSGARWLVGGVAGRVILDVSDPDRISTFLPASEEAGSLFGMTFDSGPDLLWVAEAWGDGLPGGSGPRRTGLLKLSSIDGKVLGRFPLPDDGKPHQLGDVVVGDIPIGGNAAPVYASDALGGGIYQLAPGAGALSPLVRSGEFASPQGMAMCRTDSALVVADYPTGLHRIDLESGEVVALEGGDRFALAGIDGLVWNSNVEAGRIESGPMLPLDLIATQNGVVPQRVLAIQLSPDCRSIIGVAVLAANLPEMEDLSLGAIEEEALFFVGRSQWAGWDAEGKPLPDDPGPVRLLRLRFPREQEPLP